MRIGGFQPLSLLDFPGHPCAIVFTKGCFFRCTYCHNPELIPCNEDDLINQVEIFEYLRSHSNILEGVCITGGEPTLQNDLIDFMSIVKRHGFLVKLDTNGSRPEVVREILSEHLVDYIAMDLKAPWSKYGSLTRITNMMIERCMETFSLIQRSGVDHEFRTTVLPGFHQEDDFLEMAGYLVPGERYAIQKIRYEKTLHPIKERMPFDGEAMIKILMENYPLLNISLR